jgi:hypothetical protein
MSLVVCMDGLWGFRPAMQEAARISRVAPQPIPNFFGAERAYRSTPDTGIRLRAKRDAVVAVNDLSLVNIGKEHHGDAGLGHY